LPPKKESKGQIAGRYDDNSEHILAAAFAHVGVGRHKIPAADY
jgi:hypothetical protein